MAVTESTTVDQAMEAPPFNLPAANAVKDRNASDAWSLDDFADFEALAVVFTCNHCPYAQHVEDALIDAAHTYAGRGVAFVAICPNDADNYPEDSMEAMRKRAQEKRFPFPYLRDDAQDVTHAYGARCTPDLFLFDANRRLAYRGQIDETRPKSGGEATGADLRRALDELLEQGKVTMQQIPSVGCSIKWKK